jgi:hypothetical protein
VPYAETFDPEEEPRAAGPSIAVILMGVVVPLLIAIVFGWYVYSRGEQARFEAAVRRAHAEAVELDRARQPEAAYRKFMAILAAAANREVLDAATRKAVADAREGAIRVFPAARAEFERRRAVAGSSSGQAHQFATALLSLSLVLAAIAILLAPLVVPAILARRGVFDVTRWLIMAGFFLFLSLVVVAFWYVVIRDGGGVVFPWWEGPTLVSGLGFFSVWLLLGVPGCLLASAVHRPGRRVG